LAFLLKKRRVKMRKAALFGVILCIFILALSNLSFAQCYGDFNCDGDVDGDDFAKFVLSFGETNCSGVLYVDVTTGQDLPSHGGSPDKPLKTITYALSRSSCCCNTTIHIAPGTYNENFTIDKNKIRLKKKEATTGDVIVDGGGQDVITIDGARGIIIEGLSIQNGAMGIYVKFGATVAINSTILNDNTRWGIYIGDNSTAQINGLTVMRSGMDGIRLHASSSADITGTIISNNNSRAGILISNNSDITFFEATVETSDNGRGLWTIINSSIFFYQSKLTAKNNKDNNGQGIKIGDSSSVFLVIESEILSEGNSDDGLEIWGSSRFNLSSDSMLTIRDNGDKGFKISEGSSAYLAGNITVENNDHYGIILEPHSSAALEGSMQSLNNNGFGLIIDKSSALAVRDSGMLTVSGTTGGHGIGILVSESSALRVNGGLLVEKTTGQYGKGIDVIRSSSLALQGSSLDAKIHDNQAEGVNIGQGSSGRFDAGTEIYDNTLHGINTSGNSSIYTTNVSVHDNGGNGIKAFQGSFIDVKDSSIVSNTSGDINLSLGAVSFLNGNTIGGGGITCDSTVDSQGDIVCP
jgi:hypothetical protein